MVVRLHGDFHLVCLFQWFPLIKSLKDFITPSSHRHRPLHLEDPESRPSLCQNYYVLSLLHRLHLVDFLLYRVRCTCRYIRRWRRHNCNCNRSCNQFFRLDFYLLVLMAGISICIVLNFICLVFIRPMRSSSSSCGSSSSSIILVRLFLLLIITLGSFPVARVGSLLNEVSGCFRWICKLQFHHMQG